MPRASKRRTGSRIAEGSVGLGIVLSGLVALGALVSAQQTATRELGIKYVRDSEEYAALARQIYRLAGDAAERAAASGGGPWAVVLDIDETTLDNSTYQVERAVYGLPFEPVSWAAWVERRQAPPVPGVSGFLDRVRHAGGHVAWITNRDSAVVDATRANLTSVGLWDSDDRLCPQHGQSPKALRRHDLVTGTGDCAYSGTPMRVVAFIGDQMGDFPSASEGIAGAGTDAAFGVTCFLLPNPMYGEWTSRVTRIPPSPHP